MSQLALLLLFRTLEDARSRSLGWARAVADYAAQIVALYSQSRWQNKRPPTRSGLLFAP
jgi:hypothetical protein